MDLDTQPKSSPPADFQPKSPSPAGSQFQTINVPQTKADLWAAVRKRAIQLFKEERNNCEYGPSSSKKVRPFLHPKMDRCSSTYIARTADLSVTYTIKQNTAHR